MKTFNSRLRLFFFLVFNLQHDWKPPSQISKPVTEHIKAYNFIWPNVISSDEALSLQLHAEIVPQTEFYQIIWNIKFKDTRQPNI